MYMSIVHYFIHCTFYDIYFHNELFSGVNLLSSVHSVEHAINQSSKVKCAELPR